MFYVGIRSTSFCLVEGCESLFRRMKDLTLVYQLFIKGFYSTHDDLELFVIGLFLRQAKISWAWRSTPLILALSRQRQAALNYLLNDSQNANCRINWHIPTTLIQYLGAILQVSST